MKHIRATIKRVSLGEMQKKSLSPLLAAASLLTMGLLFLFSPLLHLLGTRAHSDIVFYHHTFHASSVISLPVLGIFIAYLAVFVYHRRRIALYTGMCAAVMSVLYLQALYPLRRLTLVATFLCIIYVITALLRRKEFFVRNSLEGVTQQLFYALTIILFGLAYGITGFHLFSHRLFHADYSLLASLDMTIDAMTGFSGTIAEPTRVGQLFIDSLTGIGIMLYGILLGALFQPLRLRIWSTHSRDRRTAEAIIKATSTSSEDFFKLWPEDKSYYFSHDASSFLAYKQARRTIVILGDPVGRAETFAGLIGDFTRYCTSLGWHVAVVNATENSQPIYTSLGLTSLFVGNEAIIDVPTFLSTTSTDKHFRYVRNRAARDTLRAEEWRELDGERLAILRRISDSWLARNGRREYGFFMGYFDRQYLRQCRLFVLYQDTKPVAYVNLIPSYHKGHASIDQLRSLESISPVGMYYTLTEIITTLNSEHVNTLNIGLTPLSDITNADVDSPQRALLRLTRVLGGTYYSFSGLEQFKRKFRPTWEPRSLLFTGSKVNAITISRDVERISAYHARGSLNLYVYTLIALGVLTAGLNLILA